MTQYNVEANITEIFFVDADDIEEAALVAERQIVEGYEVMPSQVNITNIKEVK